MQEKKGFIEAIKNRFYEKKLYKAFETSLENHSKLTNNPIVSNEEIEKSEQAVRSSFINLAKKRFPNVKAGLAFDRLAFFVKHQKEFEKLTPLDVKDYPKDNLSKEDVKDLKTIYNFSHTYEKTIYTELSPEERKGYRGALMATGQIAGYVSVPEFQKVASSLIDMRQQSLNANTPEKQALKQTLINKNR